MFNKSYLNDIIYAAEADNTTLGWFNSGKYSMGIVNNINGRRITFCKALCKELGLKDTAYVLVSEKTDTIVVAGSKFSNKASALQLNTAEKKTCYNADAVKKLTDVFALDFKEHTSLSFNDITIEDIDNIPIATVIMNTEAYNAFINSTVPVDDSDNEAVSYTYDNNENNSVSEKTDEILEAFDDEDVQGDEV